MKTAIYIEDGVVQLVLTPQNEFETNALRSFEETGNLETTIRMGQFYDCHGGWARHHGSYQQIGPDRSLIIRTEVDSKR